MVACFLFTMHNVTAVIRIEITRVTKNFQESANAFFCFLLSFFLHVHCFVLLVQMGKHFIDQFEKFKWCFIVELDHAQVTHERRSVQSVDNDFYLLRVQIRRF